MLIILTGKTASGKDTVIAKLLSGLPGFKKVATTTSRALRAGEKKGVDYNFLSREDFKQKIEKGDFIEYVEYGGNFYGTEKNQLEGNNLIWRIDPSRAGKIRELINSPVLVIYLTVPDSVVLERLRKRGFTEEDIEKRMKEDQKFWEEYKDRYDFVVENVPGQLDQAVDKIIGIVKNCHS
ncbi:hypothetical protein A3J19_00400 [Candidatus Daviesbacteria bacterium RIFCSPLOWO2_02_FULL_41_8]|uniref:Guanylate kinase n=3 Tax=Candidatus Daviesiibacteriota TaxID=1752718 RepID=A0A1F5NGM8_9BACT|nr:MAG: hypothetical protein A2871_02745 [Candidatus Daviesbacteria bacterium RIFCSPHIGHO2_01_FULL_41_23]OGE33828.1 MAG: hypothetical protein A3D83_04620 [Candidatus Daviesbacteria bacterium RIFCSPHIGHO2_02_FULL_41_10]OGE62095.1 MAG: hypothetical protein A2967_00360 [Candidatus Daviesbacteria bacterium RIFCSPLOWO2_01_FULL_41_32]OGE76861.1 MAG: hypothetical protein A3J19_00400 [Candidatus Daviesbacteria bacterium RIFCSPLOWO2_02_FULL_41_8]